MSSFTKYDLHEDIIRAIHDLGFEEPSPIQEASIPVILKGEDVVGQAQTGTGKTAAFGIPVIERVTDAPVVQALILTPTRELAIQVSGELKKLSKYKKIKTLPIYGGQSIGHQIKALKQGVQVVIGTPGRILDHLRRRTLKLNEVKMMVLDEADEMLDMGFIDDIEAILRQMSPERQTLLFSATMPDVIKKLTYRYMNKPKWVSISHSEVVAPLINQFYYKVLEKNKLEGLCRILDSQDIDLGIIFCRTKRGVDELSEALQTRGYLTDGLHGDLSQAQRDRVMKAFRDMDIELLIATDVAARGIDVGNVTHVINYDVPQDPESYVHRIGRTGRAGKTGLAITLVTPREMSHLRSIEEKIKHPLESKGLPRLEEISARKKALWKRKIVEQIEKGQTDDVYQQLFAAITSELEEHYDLRKICSALLNIAFSDTLPVHEESYEFGETGASKGMVRFFMNVGRNVNLNPQILMREIADLVGISTNVIGRIDIFDKFTFVEVPKEEAPFVYETLKHAKINGSRVVMEPAKPRSDRTEKTTERTRRMKKPYADMNREKGDVHRKRYRR